MLDNLYKIPSHSAIIINSIDLKKPAQEVLNEDYFGIVSIPIKVDVFILKHIEEKFIYSDEPIKIVL